MGNRWVVGGEDGEWHLFPACLPACINTINELEEGEK